MFDTAYGVDEIVMKKVIVVLGSLSLLFVAALAALVVFFPKKKVLELAQTKASEALHTKVLISDAGISWSPFGLQLKGFQMG